MVKTRPNTPYGGETSRYSLLQRGVCLDYYTSCGHGLKLFKSHFQENGPEDSSSRSCKNSRGDSLAAATTFVQQQQQTTFLPPSVTLAQTSSTPLTDFPVPHPPGSISASTVAHSESKSTNYTIAR